MTQKPKLSILVPVFNEGVNLKYMIGIMEVTLDIPHELLIIHDIPNDDSIPVVRKFQKRYPNVRLVHNKKGRGVINAIRSGVEAARCDYILILVADDVGPVLSVEKMVRLMDQGCDLVTATRYAHGGRVLGGHVLSRLFSKNLNRVSRLLGLTAFTDATVGLKMFRKSVFRKVDLQAKPVGWVFAYEFAIKAQRHRMKLGEVPIISINRFYGGKSSFRVTKWAPEYARWFFYAVGQKIKGKLRRSRAKVLA